MKHLNILLFILLFASGAISISYIKRMYKIYKNHFLRHLLLYLILLNLSVFIYLLYEYTIVNLFGDTISKLFTWSITIIVMVLNVAMLFVFICLTETLQKKIPTNNIHHYFVIFMVLILGSYLIGMFFLISQNSLEWFKTTHVIALYLCYLFTFLVLIKLLIQVRSKPRDIHSDSILTFGTIFIVIYFLRFGSLFLSDSIKLLAYPAVLFLFNISPCIWFHRYYLKYLKTESLSNQYADIDQLMHKYMITRREREIIELILMGKSNSEISDSLFISNHTVRNHIYRLFKKMGINSRGQLIHLILESK